MKSEEEMEQDRKKRAQANDPTALYQMGMKCRGEGQYDAAVEYYTKAAALGEMMAHFNLSILYDKGEVVDRDLKKKVYHLEEAAIGGHPVARYNLGCHEGRMERFNRAVKHFIIAAKLGHDKALDEVKYHFTKGLVSKDDYAAALRGHQAAVDATKSQQREEAYAASHGIWAEHDRNTND